MFTGAIPFSDLRDGAVILAVSVHNMRPSRPLEPATGRGLSDDVWNLMQECWLTQPTERPDMDTVVHRLGAAQVLD